MTLTSELQRDLGQLQRDLGRVESKIDTLVEQSERRDNRLDAFEVRTRRLENRQHWYSGITAAFGALLGFGGAHTFLRW